MRLHAIVDMVGDAKSHIFGAAFARDHGLVSGTARVEADDAAPADDLARLAKGLGITGREVNPVRLERARKTRVVTNERRRAGGLHGPDQRLDVARRRPFGNADHDRSDIS